MQIEELQQRADFLSQQINLSQANHNALVGRREEILEMIKNINGKEKADESNAGGA